MVKIGDELGGGVIAYVDATGEHGLIVKGEDLCKKYDFDKARVACDALGDGWHLPTKDELNLLHLSKDVIYFRDSCYWSSTESSANFAWTQYFGIPFKQGSNGQNDDRKSGMWWVRTVKSF